MESGNEIRESENTGNYTGTCTGICACGNKYSYGEVQEDPGKCIECRYKEKKSKKIKCDQNMIKIGWDSIFKNKSKWVISTLEGAFSFNNKREAIEHYCQNYCNPIYNEIHYDCESCPIKEEEGPIGKQI